MLNVSKLNITIGKIIRQVISPDPRNISTFLDAISNFAGARKQRS